MSYDTKLLEPENRQLMDADMPPKAGEWTEIGEAVVTHTIFGKAKVKIVRKKNNINRVLFLLGAVVVIILAWQGWVFFGVAEKIQGVDFWTEKNVKLETAPLSSPVENITEPNAVVLQYTKKSELLQPQIYKESDQTVAKPVIHQPMVAIKPQSGVAAAANKSALVSQINRPLQVPQSPMLNVAPPIQSPRPIVAPANVSSANTAPASPLINTENSKSPTATETEQADPNSPKQ